ncbi:type III pantothenate kinase [Tenacibaculum maritimum]|uniref:type III pantothenate kinase n=1 Tax=Tenacibaculum maritimum TaxID=107401 RepID=UPI0038763C8C
MNLIIDIGNTRGKIAVFEEDMLVKLAVFEKEKLVSEVKKNISKYDISNSIISSVTNISKDILEEIKNLGPFLELNSETPVPFTNLYETPNTLGVDRIALAAGAVAKYPNQNKLVIDAGTCITFDFVNKKDEYLGGAISPGVKIRYQALHTFTSKLPLLEMEYPSALIGNNTNSAIHSGIINGVCSEIDGIINKYKRQYGDLTVVLTGGDTNFLAKQLKSSIFANPNFILEGLRTILIYNKTND